MYKKDLQYYKFCLYGFFKNIKLFEPFIMLFFIDKGISFFQIGILYAIREIGINILEIPTGALADLLGRKRTMIVSFLAYIFSFAIFSFANSFVVLAVAMIFYSIGDAMRTGTHKAMIFDYLKLNNWLSYKVAYYGRTRSWSQIGSAFSSLIAAWFVFTYESYQLIFLLSIFPFLADLILITSYPSYLNGPISASSIRLKESIGQYFFNVKASFKDKEIWKVWLNVAAYQGIFKSSKDYLQPIIVLLVTSSFTFANISSIKLSALIIGVVYFIVYFISSFASRYASITLVWFRSSERVLNLTFGLGALALISIGFFIDYIGNWFAIFSFLLLFVIQNIRKPIGTSLLASKVDNSATAMGISVQSQFDSIFASLFALLIGFLADRVTIGTSIGVVGVLVLPLVILFRLRTK